uniref:Uncharacterized protein n=1 Tax=Elaeophora elaphi TaxID=1147741 RepID=A0A0R3RFU4_9BILA
MTKKTRCLGRETFLTDTVPASCSSTVNCPNDYERSRLITTNECACCKEKKKLTQICPDNRDSYRRFTDDGLLYCDNNDFACPRGYFYCLTIHLLLNDRFLSSRKKAQLDASTNQAKRCFTDSSDDTTHTNDCLEGFSCQQSTAKYLRVCCHNNTVKHTQIENKFKQFFLN